MEARYAEAFPIGTKRKWRSGQVVKTRQGWEPVRASASPAKRAAPASTARPKAAASPAAAPQASAPKAQAAHDEKAKRDFKNAKRRLDRAIQSGRLKSKLTPDQHVEIGRKFLSNHAANLKSSMDRLGAVAVEGSKVKGRIKALPSAIGKLVKKPAYGTLDKLQDGTGMRVISKTADDVLENVKRIKQKYEVVSEDDYVSKPKDGYRSYHMIVRDEDGLEKEVQVRTANQDVWADWSHDIYKPKTPEQKKAIQDFGEELDAYAADMSTYFATVDSGKSADRPDCPPVIRKSLSCMGEEEEVKELPDEPERYFNKPPGSKHVSIDQLQTIRARPEGIANAEKHMLLAFQGKSKKRDPITLRQTKDGYEVVDGNSTVAIARKHGWKNIIANVVS
jgi:ppGpp synthetase/RelA/SpoT-type nucleotidyltranferase